MGSFTFYSAIELRLLNGNLYTSFVLENKATCVIFPLSFDMKKKLS